MTLTFTSDLHTVKMNQPAWQISGSKVIVNLIPKFLHPSLLPLLIHHSAHPTPFHSRLKTYPFHKSFPLSFTPPRTNFTDYHPDRFF